MTNTNELDLDALVPESKYIKLNNERYEVKPPTLKVLPKITRNLNKLAGLENDQNPDQVAEALDELTATVRLIIPDLPTDTELSMAQSTAIIQLVMEMVTPPEQKALAEQGLLPDADQKKTD